MSRTGRTTISAAVVKTQQALARSRSRRNRDGGTSAVMKNEKGVEMKVETMTKGLSLKLAAEGVKVSLEK